MFRLQRRAVAFTRIRDQGGKKSLTFEVNTALRIHSTQSAAYGREGRRMLRLYRITRRVVLPFRVCQPHRLIHTAKP